ncbi:MAG: DsbA family oxidoreductase [Ignavibacteriaceae bacterium]|jgi:predicted DsbA family dithiol-disulfide isomerase|nr:DsbA family oxidoreductase [Ignavibacteriaceae bacterium]
MKVEIWSDVICPFCYIGKKHFEKALRQLSFKDLIKVEWKSFQLDPSLPDEGLSVSTGEYLINRKGMPAQQIESMFDYLKQKGADVGIEFRQDISIQSNTFKAHRLIHFAQDKGKGNEMEEVLFAAHFSEGKNIGDIKVLTELAENIGLNKTKTAAFLKSEEKTGEVNKDIQEAQTLGIHGVPFFVIDRKYGVSGTQPVEAFVEALTQAYQESKPKFEMIGKQDEGVCEDDNCKI